MDKATAAPSKMERTNFFYPVDLIARLRRERYRTGIPMSQLIRLAIVRFLDDAGRFQKPMPRRTDHPDDLEMEMTLGSESEVRDDALQRRGTAATDPIRVGSTAALPDAGDEPGQGGGLSPSGHSKCAV